MILGMCKNVGVTPDYVLYDMAYENLILFGYATPVYDSDDDKFDERLDANNPELAKKFGSGKTQRVTNPFI